MTTTMTWILGLDLRTASEGAIAFARKLSTLNTPEIRHRLIPVHVLEQQTLQPMLRYHHLAEVEREVLAKANEQLGEMPGAEPVQLVQAVAAERALGKVATERSADAIIVGRQAPTEGRALIRLGRVARRLVRELPTPVVVVPPDQTVEQLPDGPVMLASDLEGPSGAAATFARRLSSSIDEGLFVAHVVPSDEELVGGYVPSATIQQLYAQLELEGEQGVQAWCRSHGLEGVPAAVARGAVMQRLVGIAEKEHAGAIVCGSRHLNAAQRLFASSIGSGLAAHARRPVVVVPQE